MYKGAMAYHVSASPFTFLRHDPNLFCNSTYSPHLIQLPHRPKQPVNFRFQFRRWKPDIHIANISLQEREHTAISEDSHNPDEKPNSSSKLHIWVNPKTPRAFKLRQKSNDFRFSSLVKIGESLDSCSAVEEDIVNVLESFGTKFVEQNAVVVLNNMSNPETALLALKYFQERYEFSEVILYNVTLKVFKKCRDFDGAEKLFDEMLQRGIKPDTVTFLTMISCARICSLPEKAVVLFEKMPSYGCEPSEGTYSVMIDVYGKVGNVDMALSLHDRARSEKWHLDVAAFITMVKIYRISGNFDACLNVYKEMKALGVKPNLVLYNSLLGAMGSAKRAAQAENIYKEMLKNRAVPNEGTYAALIRAYCMGWYGKYALNMYREMKEKGIELKNVAVYTLLLCMCADAGYTDEAIEIFNDMKNSGTCVPDARVFAAMIRVYARSKNVEETEKTMDEMLEAGFEPNIIISTTLMQCYGKAGRIDDVVRTFNRAIELRLTLDELFCGCLLNVMAQAPKQEHAKLMGCIERANPKLGDVVKLLVDEDNLEEEIFEQVGDLFDHVSENNRQTYCNSLIDLCVNLNQLRRARRLFHFGLAHGIYTDIQSKSSTEWFLHLKNLSSGAALTALNIWFIDLCKEVESGEELPPLLGINTGHGKHKYSQEGLAVIFKSLLKEINAPFYETPKEIGWLFITKVAATSWLESSYFREGVAAARWSSIRLDVSS